VAVILWIDPGKTCGLIAVKIDGTLYRNTECSALDCLTVAESIIAQVRPLSIGVERYVITRQVMTQQTDALEVIGALRWICSKWGLQLHMQSRSDRTKVTNEMLRDLGLWTPRVQSPGGHVNEAARHAVIHLMRTQPQHVITKRLLGRIDVRPEMNGVNEDGVRRAAAGSDSRADAVERT
jgi:hypothetical protein